MTVNTEFKVYELNKVMGSEKHLALELVNFPGVTANNFDTEPEAIAALVEHKKYYEDYVILKTVYVTDY